MQQHAKVYAKVIYPNADHAFHNDTGARYNPEAAQDAWARTLAWFEQYLAP
jgi:carboxymethylenebutenolidase